MTQENRAPQYIADNEKVINTSVLLNSWKLYTESH